MSTPTKKKTTAKKTSQIKEGPSIVEEQPSLVEEQPTTETKELNKGQELWGNFKGSVSKIPHGIEEHENKLKLTTSKLFTLTGSLLAFFEGRHLFLSYSTEGTKAFSPIVGGIGMLIGIFLLSTIVADFILAAHAMKGKLPYEWFIILPLGVLLFFFNMFAKNGGVLWVKGGVILMIAGLLLLLEGLQWTKKPSPTQLIALIGFSVGIFESIMQIASDFANVWAWITGILMFLLLALLFFATKVVKLPKKITPPMSWWFALCVAVTMYFFAINYQLSGVIIIHIFLLELIEL